MPNTPGGLIRPHSAKFAVLHRFLDGVIIILTLVVCGQLLDVSLHLDSGMASAWATILFLFLAESKGLYGSLRHESLLREMYQLLLVWFMVVCTLIIIAFLTKTSANYSRRVIVAWVMLTPTMMILLRVFARLLLRTLRKHGRNIRTLAFAGKNDLSRKMLARVEAAPWMGLKVLGAYDNRVPERLSKDGLPLIGKLPNLIEDARDGKIDFVYITLPLQAESGIMQLIDQLSDTTATVFVIPDFFVFDLLNARWTSMGGVPMVSVYDSPFYGVDGWLKRAEDVLLSSLILLLISPLMLAIALGVKLSSPGPIIFKQRRYGLKGEVFYVWKFRSMRVCEDGVTIAQAKPGDSRFTPFGRFLRRTSMDELPQFFNVLQGKMSVVGPRPHAVTHNEQYRHMIHGYMLRHKVKPGITGLAQVNGWRGETDTLNKMQKRIEADMQYIHEWSLWLDLKIVFKTILFASKGKNAY